MNKCAAWECPNRTQLGYCQLSACNRMDLWQKHNPPPTTSSATRLGRYGATTTNQTEVRQDGMDHGAKMAEMLRKEELQAENARLRAELADAKESLNRKCLDERAAVKCISDIETYLELGSAKYIKITIDNWRGTDGKA